MRLDLSDPKERLGWAEHHIKELNRVIVDALKEAEDTDALRFDQRFDSETSCYVFSVVAAPTMPPDVGLRIGDALHSLRSTLDHLAWLLVKAGSDPNPAEPRKVAFPICDTSRELKGRRRTALPGVRGDQRAVIRLGQPYHSTPLGDSLRFVREYNNGDKHRTTHAHYLLPRHIHLDYEAVGCKPGQPFALLGPPPRLEVGNEVLFVPVEVRASNHSFEVKGGIAPIVGFENGKSVLDLLADAHGEIHALLNDFDRVWP